MRPALALLAAAALAACTADPPPDRARGFAPAVEEDRRIVLFSADGIRPDPADAAGLAAIAQARPLARYGVLLPAEGRPEEVTQIAEGRRAAISAALLNRPVASLVGGEGAPGPGLAVVVIQEARTVPTACLGEAEPWRRPFIPGFGGESRRLLLPAGCSSDIALQRQVERPADLTAGRAMQPGPAGPAARAIERYIFRDEPNGPSGRANAPTAGQRGESEATEPGRASGNDTSPTPEPAATR
ncbi:CpaD family pilus assembly lipoprotein [Pararoseomonas sp. SCSIO 73927]|uniref:CpaD family pilus assembly lipoprotein n=1 Tax=Pararoseomonas sp. SCSIO 73927 TaxID=3114537 RepID=UPI0030D17763